MEHHLSWGVAFELHTAQCGLGVPTVLFPLRTSTSVELGIVANVENAL